MTPTGSILFVSPLRRRARTVERELQYAIEERDRVGGDVSAMTALSFRLLRQYHVPAWAHGVRVERTGLFQHAVIATVEVGR
jgi:hypothetical protein